MNTNIPTNIGIIDLNTAFTLLEIDIDMPKKNITSAYLKKQYHKLALQNHPDKKGNTLESKEKFQKIKESYDLLLREITIINQDSEQDPTPDEEPYNPNSYSIILHLFIDGLIRGDYNEFISTTIKNIVSGYQEVTIQLFENMDKERALTIYDFLFKYKNILYIKDEVLEKMSQLIVEKYKNVQIIILNPNMSDLFDAKIYKLEIEGKKYFVPLWYSEMVFDGKDGDLIVKCIPNLPDNVQIDENNNIVVDIRIPISISLFESITIPIILGNKRWDIPLNQLYMKQKQNYIFKKCGILRIAEKDIYNMHQEKGDIVVHITFVS